MLIPKFSLEQNDDTLTVHVFCPYSNVQDTEVYVEGKELIFSSAPYHLRLTLPGEIIENDKSTGKYECDGGCYTFNFDKINKGEYFPNLDMITSLKAPKDIPDLNPDLIEVLDDSDTDSADESSIFECSEPTHSINEDISFTNHKFAYGFGNKLKGDFKNYGEEFPNIFELKTPEEISYDDRKRLMEEHETTKFSSDHYLADYFEDDLIKPLIDFQAPWETMKSKTDVQFTSEELDVLKELPNKEYLLTAEEYNRVTYSIVDVLFSYCYEKRITMNENTIESSWTINKISGTLSWFAVFSSLKDTLISCYRRSLIYPMYRNFKLSCKIHRDVEAIFKLGRKYVVKCLIDIYKLFSLSQDARYILNQLYIKDFLVFSQKCSENNYDSIHKDLSDVLIDKLCLNLDLEEYEDAGRLVQMEESNILENTVALKMSTLKLTHEDHPKVNNVNKINTDIIDSDDSSEDSSESSCSSSSELDSDDESES